MTDPAQPVGYVTKLFAHSENACAVFDDGSMRCWGDNTYGQLGFGELWSGGCAHITQGLPPVDRMAIGAGHMCALTTDRCVWCWGDGSYHQLGVPGIWGSALPVRLEGMTNVIDVAAESSAGLALRDDGRVQYWGFDVAPQLLSAKTPTTWVKGAPYTSIACGSEFTCGLRSDGTVECWGDNEFGQLGNADKSYHERPVPVAGLTDVVRIEVGAWASCAVRADKTLWCWGSNASGQLADGTTTDQWMPQKIPLTDVEDVALSTHVCAIVASGRVFCWGVNLLHEVGNGAVGDAILTPWEIKGIEGARAVSVGWASTCVLMGDHDVRCWGYNADFALGNKTVNYSSKPMQVQWECPP